MTNKKRNSKLEEKRKYILRKIENDERYLLKNKQFLNFCKFSGPGFKRKMLRLLFSPSIYIPYVVLKILNKIGKLPEKEVLVCSIRKIKVKGEPAYEPIFTKSGFLNALPEIKLTKFLVKNLKESDIFYDIGANFGFYTFLALEFCKEVHAFEPLSEAFENLYNNLRGEERVVLNNFALSNKIGNTKLSIAGGRSSIVFDVSKEKRVVKTFTLDEYIRTHNPPTVLKIDVEGAENLVLEGGRFFLEKNSPIIVIEVWEKFQDFNTSHKRAINFLKELGYKCYKINEAGELSLASYEDYKQITIFDNLVFTK